MSDKKTLEEILDYLLWGTSRMIEIDLEKTKRKAKQAITQAMLNALPEWHKVDPIRDIDYRYCVGWNECRDQMEAAIKEIGASR